MNTTNPMNPINKIRGKHFTHKREVIREKREKWFHFLKEGRKEEI
jgi:hypothetical protein